jgi:hypothetical protein
MAASSIVVRSDIARRSHRHHAAQGALDVTHVTGADKFAVSARGKYLPESRASCMVAFARTPAITPA